MKHDVVPLIKLVELDHSITMALIKRREGRRKRQLSARKGWRTRRDREKGR